MLSVPELVERAEGLPSRDRREKPGWRRQPVAVLCWASAKCTLGPYSSRKSYSSISLENWRKGVVCATVIVWEGEIEKRDFSFPKQAQCAFCRSPVMRCIVPVPASKSATGNRGGALRPVRRASAGSTHFVSGDLGNPDSANPHADNPESGCTLLVLRMRTMRVKARERIEA
jgi:hypothetical protein